MTNFATHFIGAVIVIYCVLVVGEMLVDHITHEAPTSPTCSWCTRRHAEHGFDAGPSTDLAKQYPHLAASHNRIDHPESPDFAETDPTNRKDT